MKVKEMREKGITLIALVVTIIILLILAGVTLNIALSDNGLFGKAKKAVDDYGMAQAREKLEMTLADIKLEKSLNPNYSSEDLKKQLEEAGYEIDDNTVIIDDWRFELDVDNLEVGESLGKGKKNENIVLTLAEEPNEDYVKSVIKATVKYSGKIISIKIAGEVINDIEKGEENTYTVNKEVEKNGTYKVYVYAENEEYNTGIVEVKEITEDITISDAQGLAKFRDEVNKGRTYEGKTVNVLSNIDLSEQSPWTPIGTLEHSFKGTFEGNYYQIDNIKIDNSNYYQGLFGVNSGTIQDLVITSGSIKGGSRVGGIVGENQGKIKNCGNNIPVSSDKRCCGGIAGSCNKSYAEIICCYNSGNISSLDTDTESHCGGIVGSCDVDSRLENCYNIGTISGYKTLVGGINGGTAHIADWSVYYLNCYNIGDVTIRALNSGNFVGNVSSKSTDVFENCFCKEEPTIRK